MLKRSKAVPPFPLQSSITSIRTTLPLPLHVLLGLPGGSLLSCLSKKFQDYFKSPPKVWLVTTKPGIYAPFSVTTLHSTSPFSQLLSWEYNVLLQHTHIFCHYVRNSKYWITSQYMLTKSVVIISYIFVHVCRKSWQINPLDLELDI
jgi:hypothetical protein